MHPYEYTHILSHEYPPWLKNIRVASKLIYASFKLSPRWQCEEGSNPLSKEGERERRERGRHLSPHMHFIKSNANKRATHNIYSFAAQASNSISTFPTVPPRKNQFPASLPTREIHSTHTHTYMLLWTRTYVKAYLTAAAQVPSELGLSLVSPKC